MSGQVSDQNKAYIYTAFVILFWSTVATVFKLALQTVNPYQLLFFAAVTAWLIFVFLLLARNKFRALLETPVKVKIRALLIGLINPFLFYLILFKAYDLLPGQIAMSLNFSWPIVLSMVAIPFQKQPLNSKSVLALLLGFAGVVAIATKGEWISWDQFNIWGIILVLSSTVLWSVYWMLNMDDNTDPLIKLTLNFTSGTLAIILFFPVFSGWHTPQGMEWFYLIYAGCFDMGITFILWFKALSLTKATVKISVLIFLIPFLSLIFLNMILGEEIFLTTFLGLMLIVSGILLQKTGSKGPTVKT